MLVRMKLDTEIAPFESPHRRAAPPPAPTVREIQSIPFLWELALTLLAAVLAFTGQPADLAARRTANRKWLRLADRWLKPVERLVRMLLICRAATHLAMTPEGRELLLRRPNDLPPPPAPVAPPPPRRPPARLSVPYPGFASIAQHWRPKSPPVETRKPVDPSDPATWRCRFVVLSRLRASEEGDRRPPSGSPEAYREMIAMARLQLSRKAASQVGVAPSAMPLARRIEALARVLRNPAAAIRRLARQIAGLPAGVLAADDSARRPAVKYLQGQYEIAESAAHCGQALRLLERCTPRPPEPG